MRAAAVGIGLLLAVPTLTPTGMASASAYEGSAADTIAALVSQGYSVQLNGTINGSLAQCTVTDVHGVAATAPAQGTVYVDIDCPGSD